MQQYFAKTLENDVFTLKESDFHHIINVMRFDNGSYILVGYQGSLYLCALIIDNGLCKARIIEKRASNSEFACEITLIYGLPKTEKFEMVLQKATELGVTRIVSFLSERSVVKLETAKISKKMERWEKIIKEAAEQSHRSEVPSLVLPIKESELSNYLSELNLCGDETKCGDGSGDLFSLLETKPCSISFIIGPEGGFSSREFQLFTKLGFKGISLGNRILRSETAVIYLLSIIGFMLENKGEKHD